MCTFKSYPNANAQKIMLGVIWQPRDLWNIFFTGNVLIKVGHFAFVTSEGLCNCTMINIYRYHIPNLNSPRDSRLSDNIATWPPTLAG